MKRSILLACALLAGALFMGIVIAASGWPGVYAAVASSALRAPFGRVAEHAPDMVSYQGYLVDSANQPINATVSLTFAIYDTETGGNLIWTETHPTVPVNGGYFTVLLGGNSAPLTSAVFSGSPRYLQVAVDGGPPLPRQRIASAPYALQANIAKSADTAMTASTATTATTALSAPWSGLTGVPAGFADGVDDTGGDYANVIVVAKSGGDFTSIAEALESINSASASNRYLVWVAPGVYTETNLSRVKPYVHLKGAGPNTTVLRSTRSTSTIGPDAATVELQDNARISELTIRNEGSTSTYAIAIYSATPTSRSAVLDNVIAEANGSGGVGHFAIYLNDAEPTLRHSTFKASGATGTAVNAALGSVNIDGGFPQPLIEQSYFEGKGASSGYGFQMTNSAPDVRHSYIFGDFRGIFAGENGLTEVQNSHLQEGGSNDAYLFETTASAAVLVANSAVFYLATPSHKHTGTGNLVCVHSYKANYTAASDGNTAATACN